MTLDLSDVTLAGTGSVAFARSTGGAFTAVSTATAFAKGDVLRITTSDFSDWLALAIPIVAALGGLDDLYFNPSENGTYYAVIRGARTYDLGDLQTAGSGSVAFARSSGGAFSSVAGVTAFADGDVLRATVTGISGYYAFTVPEVV